MHTALHNVPVLCAALHTVLHNVTALCMWCCTRRCVMFLFTVLHTALCNIPVLHAVLHTALRDIPVLCMALHTALHTLCRNFVIRMNAGCKRQSDFDPAQAIEFRPASTQCPSELLMCL
jgi:hypothetical protein